jgi:apolipoprotein N-acyltransferase
VLLASLPPLLLAAYGQSVLGRVPDPHAPQLRLGLVQANITDLEARRRSQGTYEVVRELLDTHFAMTYDAVERQRADAVLWSETVYPTTFDRPKSEAGAGFDREIRSFVDAARVPLVFGTYDRDAGGRVQRRRGGGTRPGAGGLLPQDAAVSADRVGARVAGRPGASQGLLPWAGSWQPGSGARVLPLRLRDGREVPVQPLDLPRQRGPRPGPRRGPAGRTRAC